jgi:hypothetical protein
MDWQPIKTAPKDGTQILLSAVDDDGVYGIRHGFYENRQWYDIDGEEVQGPQFWCAVKPPPGGR